MIFQNNDLLVSRRSASSFVEQIIRPHSASVLVFDENLDPIMVPSSSLHVGFAISASVAHSASFAHSSSWAPGGGSQLYTGSTYPITSSWANSASWAAGGGTILHTGSTYPITASVAHTASFAHSAVSASFALFANTASWARSASVAKSASFAQIAWSSSYAHSASVAKSASFASRAESASFTRSASFAQIARSASYAHSASFAQTAWSATSASFAKSASLAKSASFANSASYAHSASVARSASFAQTAWSASYAHSASVARSASFAQTARSASVARSASFAYSASVARSASFAQIAWNAQSASFADTAKTASFARSASLAKSASFARSASTAKFANSASWANSASFAQTARSASVARSASFAQIAWSASYARSASVARSASFANMAKSASFANIANTASLANTASFAKSASFVELARSASFVKSASFARSASHADIANTASFVNSASFATRANIFTTDLIVYLSGGKTFGKYASGETIPATGKTPAEVIALAIVEPINPTVNLSSPTSIAFNQTAIANVLNFSYVIHAPGTTAATVSLEWRRNGAGSWVVLSTNTGITTYTHNYVDSAYNTQPFNYRYIVTDNVGGTATATVNITPAAYVAPSISLSVVGTSIASPETNTKRERGNTATTLSGTITRNSANVALSSYSVQFQINGGTWSDVPGLSAIPISGASATIPSTSHTPTSVGTTSVGYRVVVVDAFTTTTGSTTTITFLYMIYYGPVATAPLNSAAVRALGTRIFTDGSNPYNLLTGTTNAIFTSAMPATLAITQVLDLDALNANITANYILSTFNVNDAGGNAVSYRVYTLTNALPYSASHRHQTTRA